MKIYQKKSNNDIENDNDNNDGYFKFGEPSEPPPIVNFTPPSSSNLSKRSFGDGDLVVLITITTLALSVIGFLAANQNIAEFRSNPNTIRF